MQDISRKQLSKASAQPSSAGSLSPNPRSRFRQVLSRSPTASSTLVGLSPPRFQKLPVGTRVEVSPSAFKIARRIGELIEAEAEKGSAGSAGSALIIDYGGDNAYGSSFRVCG